jgi:hypothetical protein
MKLPLAPDFKLAYNSVVTSTDLTMYSVIDLDAVLGSQRDGGEYETLGEARGCVAFDGLDHWQIWHGDALVEECDGNIAGDSPSDRLDRLMAEG